ncbi:hypothetical protein [Actinosynnema pretiosum]|uniref:hypothetical protein n=1 Tax=Actinosynnema pretiosum TaxID=42197 RepID=UPI0012FD6CCE|nr:hypothetical protein [Actinosynnema pretiosum]
MRGRGAAAVGAAVSALTVLAGQGTALAADTAVAAGPLDAPVAFGAVGLGAVGMVLGVIRFFRKREVPTPAALPVVQVQQAVQPTAVEPLPGDVRPAPKAA